MSTRPARIRPTDGAAVVGALLGLASIVVAMAQPYSVPAAALGAAAVVSALVSRRRLRRDAELRGTALSLLAFLTGGAVVFFVLLLPALLHLLLMVVLSAS